jgi:hypothetical protein
MKWYSVPVRLEDSMMRILSLLWLSALLLAQSAVALGSGALGGQNTGESKPVGTSSWIVTGIAQKPDGSPASGVEMYVFPYKDGNLLHGIGLKAGKFGLSNPSATTDAAGRFRIEIPQMYLKEYGTDDFAVGVYESATPANPTGVAHPLKDFDRAQAMPILNTKLFNKTTGILDLNTLFKKIVIE